MSTKWEEWYKRVRDELTENIGQCNAFQVRQNRPEWDKYMLEKLRDFLDIMDIVWHENEDLIKRNEDLIKRLEKRDNDITDVLTKIQEWMAKYQTLLDKMNQEDQELEKVKEEDG